MKTAKIIAFPTDTRVEQGANHADNPFLNTNLFEGMMKYENAGVAVAKEIEAIIKSGGSGRKCPDARHAPSLQVLHETTRKRRTFTETLHAITTRAPGSYDNLLGPFGFQCWDSPFGKPARIAIDLTQSSRADAIFRRKGIINWRSLVARDCAELHVEPMFYPYLMAASAVFYIGKMSSKYFEDKIKLTDGQLWVD